MFTSSLVCRRSARLSSTSLLTAFELITGLHVSRIFPRPWPAYFMKARQASSEWIMGRLLFDNPNSTDTDLEEKCEVTPLSMSVFAISSAPLLNENMIAFKCLAMEPNPLHARYFLYSGLTTFLDN